MNATRGHTVYGRHPLKTSAISMARACIYTGDFLYGLTRPVASNRTNVWRESTSPPRAAERPRSGGVWGRARIGAASPLWSGPTSDPVPIRLLRPSPSCAGHGNFNLALKSRTARRPGDGKRNEGSPGRGTPTILGSGLPSKPTERRTRAARRSPALWTTQTNRDQRTRDQRTGSNP
jgi:hypothetical protein